MRTIHQYRALHGEPVPGTQVAIHTRKGEFWLGYEVHSVSPSGQITLRSSDGTGQPIRKRRFTANGYEIGSPRNTLDFDVYGANRMKEYRDAREAAMIALTKIDRPTVSRYTSVDALYEIVGRLENAIAAARAAVEAIPDEPPLTT